MSNLKDLLEEAFKAGMEYEESKKDWNYGGKLKPIFSEWFKKLKINHGWTNTINKLPELEERVLICAHKTIVISQLEDDSDFGMNWVNDDESHFDLQFIDWWMPFPTLPEI